MIPLQAVIDAYVEQLHFAEDQGAGVVLMASRHLARAASSPADYAHVYREVLARAGAPVVLHWLGAAFDPQLAGYFGSDDVATCVNTVVEIMAENAGRVSGIKMSLLDAGHEITVRSRLPHGTRLFTGDDYHYVDLIAGDEDRHSDALLGAFACVAPNASAAIQALAAGDPAAYRRILGPTEALARHVFAAPTWFYKTGVAFLSWLNGHQPAFTMVGGLHARPAALVHARAAGRRGRGAGTARARRRAVERLPRPARCPGGSPRMTGRLSLNQATIKYADLPTALRVTREAGIDAVGLWREPVAEAGLATAAAMVCDWITPLPADALLARGMMGDGHVDFAAVTRLVVESGYAGDVEVEIFNQEIWDADPAETAERTTKAFEAHVAPWLPPVPPR